MSRPPQQIARTAKPPRARSRSRTSVPRSSSSDRLVYAACEQAALSASQVGPVRVGAFPLELRLARARCLPHASVQCDGPSQDGRSDRSWWLASGCRPFAGALAHALARRARTVVRAGTLLRHGPSDQHRCRRAAAPVWPCSPLLGCGLRALGALAGGRAALAHRGVARDPRVSFTG